jgi:glutaredoxin
MWVNSTNIINTDISNIVNSSYIYYYGQWCPHCADLDSYLKKTGWYDKLDLVKKEVWYDKENSVEMMEAVERLWLKADDVWIPFVVVKNWDKENYLIWSSTVIDYLKPYLWDISNSNKKVFVFVILWILAVIIPTALIKISNKN